MNRIRSKIDKQIAIADQLAPAKASGAWATLKAWKLLQAAFYQCGNEVFVPTRWTKVTPALRQWAAGLVIHGVLKDGYLHSDALKDCPVRTQRVV